MKSTSCSGCEFLRVVEDVGGDVPRGDYICEHPGPVAIAEFAEGRWAGGGIWLRWIGFVPRRPIWCPLPDPPTLDGRTDDRRPNKKRKPNERTRR